MKRFLLGGSLAVAMAIFILGATPIVPAQQADQDPAPATPRKADPTRTPQQNEAQMPASGEITTQDAKSFSGHIVQENGELVLKDPVTKVSYKLSDQQKAKHYAGKLVRVTGKLDKNSNTIQVEKVEPFS